MSAPPPPPRPPRMAAAMIGSARPRSCSPNSWTAAAGCRRRSDIVERAGQPGDLCAHDLGLAAAERRDLGLARGGEEGDRGDLEEALHRAGLGLDVLDAADRHDRAPHDERAVA